MILSVEPESNLTLIVVLISFHPLTPILLLLSIAFQSPISVCNPMDPPCSLAINPTCIPAGVRHKLNLSPILLYPTVVLLPWIKFFLPPFLSVMNNFLTYPSSVSKDYSQRNIILYRYSLCYIHLGGNISRIKTFHVSTIQTENIFENTFTYLQTCSNLKRMCIKTCHCINTHNLRAPRKISQ